MIRVRVEYDAYERKFKLLDREFGSMLDDGGVYQLSIPMPLIGIKQDDELLCFDCNTVAQA